MSALPFSGRQDLVRRVQTELRLKADGIDGRATWHAIGSRLLPAGHETLALIGTEPSAQLFPLRTVLVKAVQSALGIVVDGKDGQKTWSELAERFGPVVVVRPVSISSGKYTEIVAGRSPNRNSGTNDHLGVVFHHACGYFDGTIDWCLKTGTNAAYHVLINTDGRRAVLGQDTDRCHHAGKSTFRGRSSCNNFMLGVAFIGDTNTGQFRGSAGKALTADEIASAIEWLESRWGKYRWSMDWMTHHRIISPGRKDDLAPTEYQRIHQAVAARFA